MNRLHRSGMSALAGLSILSAFPSSVWAAAKNSTSPPGAGPPPPITGPFNPASTQTQDVLNLFWIILAMSGVVFAIICIALAINFYKFSGRPGDTEEPKQVYGNRKLEIWWTLIPTAILAVTFILTVYTMVQINDTNAANADRINITAIGHQWWWEFRYTDPGEHAVTANEIYLPLGKTAVIHVTSVDVLHTFLDQQLGRQIEAIPNQSHFVVQTPTRTGIFPGACYEYCGQGHAWMQFREQVVTPARFAIWLKHQQSPAVQPKPAQTPALLGQGLFLSLSCSSCHTINAPGYPTNGVFAPNLTHEASKWAIASVLNMSEANLARWISDPKAYKEGAYMPAFNSLGKKQINQLAAYIWTLK